MLVSFIRMACSPLQCHFRHLWRFGGIGLEGCFAASKLSGRLPTCRTQVQCVKRQGFSSTFYTLSQARKAGRHGSGKSGWWGECLVWLECALFLRGMGGDHFRMFEPSTIPVGGIAPYNRPPSEARRTKTAAGGWLFVL